MKPRASLLVFLGISLGLVGAACSSTHQALPGAGTSGPGAGTDGGTGPGTTPGIPCDVDAILQKSCRSCHAATPTFGAPMPLVTHADLLADSRSAPGKKVYERVGARIHDDKAPMPQPPNPRLGQAEMATLDAWIAKGAPAGAGACSTTPVDPGVKPLSCTPDQKIRPASRFSVPPLSATDPDLYVCYGFDTTAPSKRHVIAGAPKVDNAKVVHHILLYQADAAVDGTPKPCGAGGGQGWRLVTGWAPGGGNFELPPEAGFAEEQGTTHWAMQIHYNNGTGLTGELDETGFDLCTTDQLRPNDADIMATGTVQINIPPHSTTQTTCEFTVPTTLGGQTLKVIGSSAHMHRLGVAQYAKRVRGGVETTILDAPAFSFQNGAGVQKVDVDIQPGDTIRTMCKWKNTGSQEVKFGEGTGDEMCFAFMTYYPKITVPQFRWALPAAPIVSKCK